MKPYLSSIWNFKDKEYRFDIFLSDNFSDVGDIKQVYAFVLSKDKRKVLVVYNKAGMWILPGGGVEEDEKPLDTLIREVKEETNRGVHVNSVTPFFFQKTYIKDDNDLWKYSGTQVRYIVIVSEDNEFVSDPDGDILEAKWIDLKDFDKYVKWGKTNEMINKELPKYLRKIF